MATYYGDITCPFVPTYVEDTNDARYWHGYFLGQSCGYVEQLDSSLEIITENPYLNGKDVYAIPNAYTGVVTITIRPNASMQKWNFVYNSTVRTHIAVEIYPAMADGSRVFELPYAPLAEAIAHLPDTLLWNVQYTFSFNISSMTSLFTGGVPFPNESHHLFHISINDALDAGYWIDDFYITGLPPIGGGDDPGVSIFWTANKGCTEMP